MVWRVVLGLLCLGLVAVSPVSASEQTDLLGVRQQWIDFFKRTTADIEAIHTTMEGAKALELPEGDNNKDAFALNEVTSEIWGLVGFTELAQDVLFAARVEAGIALDMKTKPVVYADALNRFPGPVPQMAEKAMAGIGAVSNQKLRQVAEKMVPAIQDLVSAYGGWPGDFLRMHLKDEPYGKGDLPKDVVDLAGAVDQVNEAAARYFVEVAEAEKGLPPASLDYLSLFRQSQRSVTSLTISVADIYMLVVAKARLDAVQRKTEYAEEDNEIVRVLLEERFRSYRSMLTNFEKQCSVVNARDKELCRRMEMLFKAVQERMAKFVI
ncbi:hypothetical protein [Fundidesulfovibrio agrisoli]|uniref:hypothetical protein n=1 Tax=Fundidesulfovibrio agrisoli TaxID=2922717 RepID=UPI001FAE6604|nr:hypothetical protein [Fundidesulfovibrio agrisoli]